MSSTMRRATEEPPLCVDLDGTLLPSDLLLESLLSILRRRPHDLLALPLWLVQGRATLKRQIALRTTLDVTSLPIHQEFVAFLRQEREAGRRLVLCTAADFELARLVADHLGLFDEVLASDEATNLKGARKALALVERFGCGGFDYAGNSAADLTVWAQARHAVLVNPSPAVAARAEAEARVSRRFAGPRPNVRRLTVALRLHQWAKNLLVFVPLLAGQRLTDLHALGCASVAFFAFGCGASGLYLLNDLLDLESDRSHPTKRARPFAAGTLPLAAGFALAPLLAAGGAALALAISLSFAGVFALYLASSVLYSFALKQWMILDVMVLALLYTLRILAGGVATGIQVSNWLLAFSIFLFLSLAIVKRVTELRGMALAGRSGPVAGRGYGPEDLGPLAALGGASGYVAVVVFALYINSVDVTRLYRSPDRLWLVCPLLLYWTSRLWLLAQRGEVHDDPLVFAIRDRTSWVVVALAAAVVAAAK